MGHRHPRGVGDDDGDAGAGRERGALVVGEDGRRPGPGGLGGEARTVGASAGQGDVQAAGPDLPGVEGEVDEDRAAGVGRQAEPGRELVQPSGSDGGRTQGAFAALGRRCTHHGSYSRGSVSIGTSALGRTP